MMTADEIIADFERNRRVIHMQADGLTHAQSLLQPPFRANCLNWVVGHIVVHRDKVLTALGANPVLDAPSTTTYDNESDPITGDEPGVVEFAALLDHLDETQRRLAEALASADLSGLVTVGDRQTTRWKRIHFLSFHDTYHTGQTELLRQVAGTDDKII